MIKVDLNINKGFKWYTENNISVKGYVFDNDQKYFEKEQLLNYFKDVQTKSDLHGKILNSNGLFTVIIKISDSEIYIANDIIRTFPIFYSTNDRDILISDDIKNIKIEKKLNILSKNEFLSAGFVSGHNTLFDRINVTQSGEIFTFNTGKINIEAYHNYFTSDINTSDKNDLLVAAKDKVDETFKRLLKSIEGKKAIIPLSGGLDSRLIACKLKELGHPDILCYTFGNPNNNQEKETSEEVAKKLGLDWIFIEYNKENIGEYINNRQFKDYCEFYTQCSSSFMFQDYFAVKYLKRNNIIPDNSVFIPGYSGDFLGGSQLYKNGGIKYTSSIYDIAKNIYTNRYTNTKLSKNVQNEIVKKIGLQLYDSIKDNNDSLAYSIFENWEIQENLSKFIGQVAHIYDFWEYEYRLPFWDNELVKFFKDIPYEYKFGKILYDEVLKTYFKAQGIDLDKGESLDPSEFKTYKFKQLIKKILPHSIIRKHSKHLDILNYDLILVAIKKELKSNPNFNENNILSRNSYIAHWFIKQLKESN